LKEYDPGNKGPVAWELAVDVLVPATGVSPTPVCGHVFPFNGLVTGVVQSLPENRLNVTVPPGGPFCPVTVAVSNTDDPDGTESLDAIVGLFPLTTCTTVAVDVSQVLGTAMFTGCIQSPRFEVSVSEDEERRFITPN
jgi:hypothetical protein